MQPVGLHSAKHFFYFSTSDKIIILGELFLEDQQCQISICEDFTVVQVKICLDIYPGYRHCKFWLLALGSLRSICQVTGMWWCAGGLPWCCLFQPSSRLALHRWWRSPCPVRTSLAPPQGPQTAFLWAALPLAEGHPERQRTRVCSGSRGALCIEGRFQPWPALPDTACPQQLGSALLGLCAPRFWLPSSRHFHIGPTPSSQGCPNLVQPAWNASGRTWSARNPPE